MTAPTKIAAMLIALGVPPGALVLEVGTGSGFVTALLLRLGAGHVRSLERYATLARTARDALGADLARATVEVGDGLGDGVRDAGKSGFDRILVNGVCPALPERLCAALAPGGRLVGAIATRQRPCLFTVERGVDGAPTPRLGRTLHLPSLTRGRAGVL